MICEKKFLEENYATVTQRKNILNQQYFYHFQTDFRKPFAVSAASQCY